MALLNTMLHFSKNTYISTEHSINHLQSKINDKKAYIKNFKMFAVVVTVHKMIKTLKDLMTSIKQFKSYSLLSCVKC